tara:strand:- start:701 stop:1588 length:888 start_codon:yes stop_codon:yes gene_type:complete
MNYQIQQSERIARGRRALIEYENLISVANEVFVSYPHYAFTVLRTNIIEFNQLDLAGTFFMETEDMENAIRIQNDLTSTLNDFRMQMPNDFEEEIEFAYKTYNRFNEIQNSGFSDLDYAVGLDKQIKGSASLLTSETQKLKDLEEGFESRMSEAVALSKDNGRGSRRILIYVASILAVVNYGIAGLYHESMELSDNIAIVSAGILGIVLFRHFMLTTIPAELKKTQRLIGSARARIEGNNISIIETKAKLDSIFSSYSVSNLEEMRAIPQRYTDLLSEYFPKNSVFPVTSVSSMI